MSDYGVREYEGAIEAVVTLKQKDLWVEFGRPVTPWPLVAATPPATGMVEQPPSPVPGATDVEAPYLYVRATHKSLVRPASDEEYVAAGDPGRALIGASKFILVADADAYTQSARWLYVKATIDVANGYPAGDIPSRPGCSVILSR